MSDSIVNSNLVNLKDKILKLIKTSPYDEVKTFFNSTTGKFLIDVLQISHGSFNYTVDALKDEMFFTTMVDYESVVNKASDLGYHIKRKIPAKMKYEIQLDDPNNRLAGISKIIFKGREFVVDYKGVNLIQENSYTYNLTDINYDYYNYMVEGSLVQDNFSITNFTNFYKQYIDDEDLSNYIDSDTDLDLKLYSNYYGDELNQDDVDNGVYLGESGAWRNLNVFRNGITEADIDTLGGDFCFSSTKSDKRLELLFGNGTLGKTGYGDYVVEYFKTSGSEANQKVITGDIIDVPTNGIEVYDNNGNILDSGIVSGLIKLVVISDLDNGKYFESSEEIKINAVKLSSINNTLTTTEDYEYYVNYNYNVNTKFWGDKEEAKNRFGENKSLNNNVFFTSPDLTYDFEENTNNIKYNILKNEVSLEVGYTQNKDGVFNVVKNCSTANIKVGDCISLSSLYLMGLIKPLTYYYNMGVVYGDNTSSIVSKILNKVDGLGSLHSNYVYLNGDILNFNANVFYTGNLTVDVQTIKNEIREKYKTTNNLVQSVNTILSKYDLNYSGVNKDYLSINKVENKSLQEFLTLYSKLREFEIQAVMAIVDRLDTTFHNSLTTPIRMSKFLRDGTRFIHDFMKHCPANKTIIITIMSYYINKYNALKSLIITNGNYNFFDISFITENINNITLTKVV